MLTAKELADIRDDVAELLPDTCQIIVVSSNQDASGWGTADSETVRATVACRLDAINQRTNTDALTEHLQSGKVLYQLTIPYDADIRDSDTVRHNSKDYQVLYVHREQTKAFVRRAVLGFIYDGSAD